MTKLLFLGTLEDQPYLPRLKPLVGVASVQVSLNPIITWIEVRMKCEKAGITGVISTSRKLLQILSGDESAKLNDYAGSYFQRDNIEIVFLDPLPQLVSVPYGPFIAQRYISKLSAPKEWNAYPQFSYKIINPSNAEEILNELSGALFIAVDIETTKLNLAITSIAYTGFIIDSNSEFGFRLSNYVMPMNSEFNLAYMRKINTLSVPKVFQNGKYDIAYLLRYNAVPRCWYWDTATAFHSWYTELPKDLGMLSAFFFREGRFWKDMSKGSAAEKLEYNARDTYATAIVWAEWMLESPAWAKTNYLQEFPVNYPCILAEATGIKRGMKELTEARAEVDTLIEIKSASLNRMLGTSNFNVNSPKQMKVLLTVLGCKDIAADSCDEKHLQKAAFRHPLINRIVDLIVGPPNASSVEEYGIRGLRKLKSTYLRAAEDGKKNGEGGAKEYRERILYSINPHGTDTGRLSSREHHFWCGLQIQNIPRGREVKQTLIADTDFRLFESDLEQAESRDTAHIAGDKSLIAAVTGERDFHSINAASFFGKQYEDIFDSAKGKPKDKPLRDLAKRVNHGANYCMGPDVLVETMGLKAIYEAAARLGLPKLWTPRQIAEHLLTCFHKAYPSLSKIYYPGIIAAIKSTRMLVSTAVHESKFQVAGWARYCFSDPSANKRALNSYVAHAPQSLNAMTLNKAFLAVFYDIAMSPEHRNNFRLLAQIHDSILFQCRVGHEYLAEEVKKRMEIPVTVKGYDGVSRTFTVPAAIKGGKDGKGALKWSETE